MIYLKEQQRWAQSLFYVYIHRHYPKGCAFAVTVPVLSFLIGVVESTIPNDCHDARTLIQY